MTTPRLSTPFKVPPEVAECPECRGELSLQFSTTDWLRDFTLDCEYEDDEDPESENHGDWQPVIDKVRAWVEKEFGWCPNFNNGVKQDGMFHKVCARQREGGRP